MIIERSQFSNHEMSKLIKGAVIPRPIAWVSTSNKQGEYNLAPFSFFTVASLEPITLCISIGEKESGAAKDTLHNINETGEFVVNIVNQSLANAMYESSHPVASHVNEFELGNVHAADSKKIHSPRVAEAPISMECELGQIIPVGGSKLILGQLVCYHIKDDLYSDDDKIDPNKLKVIGRMAGDYTHINDFFSLPK